MASISRVIAWVVAAFWLGSGAWAFFAPRSFFDQLATFPPYNEHLIHDIGAFSIGLGAVLVFALVGLPAMSTALFGVGVGSAVHVVSHIIDYDHKPDPADIVFFTVVTVLTLAAGFAFRR